MSRDRQRSPLGAGDVSRAPDVGALRPGRGNLVQTYDVGDAWVDDGAVCDGRDDQTTGCFLNDPQRSRLMTKLFALVTRAETNYKLALVELRVEVLLGQRSDVPWVLAFVLDALGAHTLRQLTASLRSLRGRALAKLADTAELAVLQGTYAADGRAAAIERMLLAVTDQRIERTVKLAVDAGKRAAVPAARAIAGAQGQSADAHQLSYLDQLVDHAGAGFDALIGAATAHANDAELVVMFEALQPERHTVGHYKHELAEKLARYKKSGIAQLGRTLAADPTFPQADVHRDRRVVWVKFRSGVTSLWYEVQDGDFNPNVARPGDPGFAHPGPMPFGPRSPRGPTRLDRAVPDEFRDRAIEVSEQIWGPVQTIEDPTIANLRAIGYDPPAPLPRLDLGGGK